MDGKEQINESKLLVKQMNKNFFYACFCAVSTGFVLFINLMCSFSLWNCYAVAVYSL